MARRTHLRLAFGFLSHLILFIPAVAAAAPQDTPAYGPLPVFELHSGFWINLHHALYHEAREKLASSSPSAKDGKTSGTSIKTVPGAKTALTAAEQETWNAAVAYYVASYAEKDPLFSTELTELKNQLGDFEDCNEISGKTDKYCDAGLPPKLTQILEAAAPVYRAHFWPDHDRANRRWITRVAPLVIEQGVGLSERLADIYQTKWPRQKIRVDVCAYANWAGAYTTLDPLRVTISSLDSRNQGNGALEVLFHEASHGIAAPVEEAIIRQCHQRDKPIPRDLWHALIFYTTGEVVRPVLVASDQTHHEPNGSSSETGYTPYALREGLYERGWQEYYALLQQFWQPYLDGRATYDDAIARMVSSL